MNRRRRRRSAFGYLGAHLALQALAAAVLVVAWSKASREPLARGHEQWLNLGIGAVLFSGAVNGLFLMGARRAVAVRRAIVYRTARLAIPRSPHPCPTGPGRAARFAASPAMTRYHRTTCALATGKPVRLERRRDHEAAGRRPCGICRP